MVKKRLSTFSFVVGIAILFLLLLSRKAFAVERYEVMQYGDKDEYVLRLQEELHARGYLEAKPTGYFGVETQAAVSRYQERHDLTSDGKAGPQTQKKIFGKYYEAIPSSREINNNKEGKESSSSKKKSSSDSKDASSIRLGDEGKTVKEIQVRLKELGYYTYRKTTSYYGEITESAVISFQQQNGLTADGVAGKRTMKALFSSKAKKYDKSKAKKSSSKKSAGSVKQSKQGGTQAENALELAKSLKGKKYRSGGDGPNTFDCSGFVSYVLKASGVRTPRSSSEMSKYTAWPLIESKDDLKKGDLVFFSSPGKTTGIGHVGIYVGSGKFIHSTSGKAYGVTTSSLSSGGYKERYQFARRCFT